MVLMCKWFTSRRYINITSLLRTFLVAQMVKRLPTMREIRVQSLGREGLLEKEMATHSRIPAWRIPWTEEPGGLSPCCCPVAQSCPTLCDPMDCSTPGFPVHRKLPELTQTHVHQVSDAIQPSHPLSSTSPLAFSLSQHQGLLQ